MNSKTDRAITIVDYGMGNIGSLENMIKKTGGTTRIAKSCEELTSAQKIILPGVGHFDNAMKLLNANGFTDKLNTLVLDNKVPILCICLGAQIAMEESEEGVESGLGWIKGSVRKFNFDTQIEKFRVPHMGWNDIHFTKSSKLLTGLESNVPFYFVHSYYMSPRFICDELSSTTYGIEFSSALERDNVYALQFHPEKSHKFGQKIIANFLEL